MAKTPILKHFAIAPKSAAVIAGDEIAVVMSNTKAFDKYVKAFKKLQKPEVLEDLGNKVKPVFNQYVPKKDGHLRRSCEVKVAKGMMALQWGKGLPYAHYQYEGVIYDFNHVYFRNGIVAGWYSSPAPKKPSKRTMQPNFRTTLFTKGPSAYEMRNGKKVRVRSSKTRRYIVRLGYSTPNTGHHWIEEITHDSQRYYLLKQNMGTYLYEQFEKFNGRTPKLHSNWRI